MKRFKPAFGLKNRHLQTLYSSLFRKLPPLEIEVENFSLEDGDFLECHWHNRPKIETSTPIIVIFHGLAGSYESPYIQGLMREAAKNGFATVLMHFRGCAGRENLKPRSYHSGDSGDALSWLNVVKAKFYNSKIFGVGYSIGGNMLLKLLGELSEKSPLDAAVSVSAPLQLDICANAMNRGFSKFYQYILLKSLNHSLEKKFEKHEMQKWIDISKSDISSIKTFWEFDESYTAPIHGFSSAQDYYTRCSSKQFLKSIQTPTLIIHSSDDPFMTTEILPTKEELSSTITLELSAHGGHVGFIAGSFLKPEYWLEKRIVHFLNAFKE
jgi:predicted alpha/beta-fold hydrolase